jgi:hypothetical protein
MLLHVAMETGDATTAAQERAALERLDDEKPPKGH